MRLFTIFALATLTLAACAPSAQTPPPGDVVQEHVARLWTEDTRTVLTGAAAQALTHQCSRVSPGPVEGQWTPTAAQLDELEDALILLLSEQLEGGGVSPFPGDYYRQYAGFVIGGKQVIYVNGFRASLLNDETDSPLDWHTQAIGLCDGGPMTFGVEYDPATRVFASFAFNGNVSGPFPPRR